MKIDNYAVSVSADRSYQKVQQQSVSASMWGLGGGIYTESKSVSAKSEGVVLSLSDLAQEMMEETKQNYEESQAAEKGGPLSEAERLRQTGFSPHVPNSPQELKLRMLEQMLERLTGRRSSLRLQDIYAGSASRSFSLSQMSIGPTMGRGQAGFGGQIRATQFEYERESISYEAKGVVQTADGKSISIDLSLSMSREAASYSELDIQFGAAQPALCDPLVINYGGTAASLTQQKFAFDLDFDGVMDNISFAGPGSGFLALDKNNDGTINDGRELFGPDTGNGFSELREYDTDGNGWIDESDAVFKNLRIWSKDADGNDQLFTLLEAGVGAIYLGDVATEFSMTDAAGQAQGVMRSTSFFLKEDGTGAGTVHHIDLVV